MHATLNHGAAAPDRIAAGHVGLSPPPRNGDARELGSEAGVNYNGKTDKTNSEAPRISNQAIWIAAKKFATLRARLALAGWVLTRSDAADGPVTFYATRWGIARELRDMAAVESFADHVGGAQ